MNPETRKLLVKCGIRQNLLGYQYLGAAVDAVREDSSYLRSVTKKLYPFVAQKYGTTCTRVERAMRHAVETAFDNMPNDLMCELFGYTVSPLTGKPTNSHFIAALAEALQSNELNTTN